MSVVLFIFYMAQRKTKLREQNHTASIFLFPLNDTNLDAEGHAFLTSMLLWSKFCANTIDLKNREWNTRLTTETD